MEKYLALLGFKVRDVITGFEGTVESICFDLYGCVQAIVKPPVNDKGEIQEGRWFDEKRLVKLGATPVMALPAFADAVAGGAEKPAFTSQPVR